MVDSQGGKLIGLSVEGGNIVRLLPPSLFPAQSPDRLVPEEMEVDPASP
jgi:hypothetical protein